MRMTAKQYRDRHEAKRRGENVPDGRKNKAPHCSKGPLTAEMARSLIDYDPLTGVLTWKRRPDDPAWSARLEGTELGREHGGYRDFEFNGRKYLAHRVVWLMVTGQWPAVVIDHVDNDGCNNRWSNLREATIAQNTWNRKPRRNSKTGLKGVTTLRNGKFRAQIMAKGHHHQLGDFDTAIAANEAYAAAAKAHFGAFARVAR